MSKSVKRSLSKDGDKLCDIHKRVTGEEIRAQYDARIKGRTTWAWMCEECFQESGAGLGTGFGQKIEWED